MKHQFGLRMLDVMSGKPLEKLWLYQSENQQLTLHDFISINQIAARFQLVCPFYIGYMKQEDVFDKYDRSLFG